MNHTPGPWFVSRDPRPDMEWNNHIACVNAPNIEICAMFHTNEKDDNAEGEANARLVAAAPDLLEAAEAVVERWDTPMWKDAPATAEFIAKLRAAIRKATQP